MSNSQLRICLNFGQHSQGGHRRSLLPSPFQHPQLLPLLSSIARHLPETDAMPESKIMALPLDKAGEVESEGDMVKFHLGKELVIHTTRERLKDACDAETVWLGDKWLCYRLELSPVPDHLSSPRHLFEEAVSELDWARKENGEGTWYLDEHDQYRGGIYPGYSEPQQVYVDELSTYFVHDAKVVAYLLRAEGLGRQLDRRRTEMAERFEAGALARRKEVAAELARVGEALLCVPDSYEKIAALYPALVDGTRGLSGVTCHLYAPPAHPRTWSIQREEDSLQLWLGGMLALDIALQ